jgi:hypothetical protein
MPPEALVVNGLECCHHQEIQPRCRAGDSPQKRPTQLDGDPGREKGEKTPEGNDPAQNERLLDEVIAQ